MYFRYQCIHLYKLEDDEKERIFCTCNLLCYTLDIRQIANPGRSLVFTFNRHNTNNTNTLPDQVILDQMCLWS